MGILETGATRAQKLLDEMERIASGTPSADAMRRLSEVMDSFTRTVNDSHDPAVVELLLKGTSSPNPGVRGLSIQSLGLVYDPRALDAVMASYPRLSGDHRQRAVTAIVNLVNNRDKNPKAIPTLQDIAKDRSLPTELRAFGVIALSQFWRTCPAVEAFLADVRKDPTVPDEVKVAAIPLH